MKINTNLNLWLLMNLLYDVVDVLYGVVAIDLAYQKVLQARWTTYRALNWTWKK